MPHPLTFVLCESALELVPHSIAHHPAVIEHARQRRKTAEKMLLDRAYHHHAMKALENAAKRGRPDIVHVTLLCALDSPLNKRSLLNTYVHTWQDYVIDVNPRSRVPRNYGRFLGLVEQLYEMGRVPPKGEPLLRIGRQTLKELVQEVNPSHVFALSTQGEEGSLVDLCSEATKEPTVFLVGGFPTGHFRADTLNVTERVFKVYREAYQAEAIASRLIYQYELAVGGTF